MAIDGTQATEVLNNSPHEIEAVLLERIMPDMDGLEVLKKMKNKPNLENIPVIMQTALTTADDICIKRSFLVFFTSDNAATGCFF